MFRYPSSLGIVTHQPEPYVKKEHPPYVAPNVQQVPEMLAEEQLLAQQQNRVGGVEGIYGWVATSGGRFPVYADGTFLECGGAPFWARRWLVSWQVGNYQGPKGPGTGPPQFRHGEITPLMMLPPGLATTGQMMKAIRAWGGRKPKFMGDLARIDPEDHEQVKALYKKQAVSGGPLDVDSPWSLHVSCRGASYGGQPGRMPRWGIALTKFPQELLDPVVELGEYLGGPRGAKGPAAQTASIPVVTEEEILRDAAD